MDFESTYPGVELRPVLTTDVHQSWESTYYSRRLCETSDSSLAFPNDVKPVVFKILLRDMPLQLDGNGSASDSKSGG